MKKTAFGNMQTKPKLGLLQGKPAQNNGTSKPSLADLMNQYEEHDYSTISLKLNNEAKLQMQMEDRHPQQGLLGFEKDSEDWAALRRQQSPFRNKENINDQGAYRNKKSVNEVNRFADCVRELEKNRSDFSQHQHDEQDLSAFQPKSTKSPLRGKNITPTSGLLRHAEEDLVFRAKGAETKNINFSELAKRFNGDNAQSQPPAQKSARSRSKVAPKIQKQFQESDESEQDSEGACLKESIREQKDKIAQRNFRPDQMEQLERKVNQIKQTNLRALAEKKQANGNKVLPKLIEDMKANVAREIEEFARSYIADQENVEVAEPSRPKPTIQPTFHQPIQAPVVINQIISHPVPQVIRQPAPEVVVEDPKKKIMEEAKWQIKEYIETKQKKSVEQEQMRYGTQPTQIPKIAQPTKNTPPAPNSQIFSFEQQPSAQIVRNQTLRTISEQRSQAPSESKSSFEPMQVGTAKMIESEWPKDPRKSKGFHDLAPPIQNIELIVSSDMTDFRKKDNSSPTTIPGIQTIAPIEDSIIHAIVPPRDRTIEQQFFENERIAEQRRLEEARRQREEWEREQIEMHRREEARLAEEARIKFELIKAEEARAKQEARLIEEARLRDEERTRIAQEATLREEARLVEQARLREEARLRQDQRLREEARLREQERIKQEAMERLAEEARIRQAELAERIRQEAEAERMRVEAQKAQADRLEQIRMETERAETMRIEAQRAEARRIEAERIEAERLEAQRKQRERLELQRFELEKRERQITQRLEAERLAAERERRQREESQQLEFEKMNAQRLENQRLELERTRQQQETQAERKRLEAEKQDAERQRRDKQRFEVERLEKQRIERLEVEFKEAQRLEVQRAERERNEKEQAARERAEAQEREIEAKRREEDEKIRVEQERLRAQQLKREEEERIRAEEERSRAEQEAKREALRQKVIEQERLLKKQMEQQARRLEEERSKLQAQERAKKAASQTNQAPKQQMRSSIKLESLFTNYSIYSKVVTPDLPPQERINKLFDTARNDKPIGGMEFKFDFGLDLDLGGSVDKDDLTGSKERGFGRRR